MFKRQGRIHHHAANGLTLLQSTVQTVPGDSSISANVLGSPLTISTSSQFAGAIYSLNWNGMEFLNHDDHGRELQSAASFDGLGECFNPTEAGSGVDSAVSTSVLLGIRASGNQLSTSTQMAFWLPVGTSYPQGCGGNPAIQTAQNSTNLSNHVLDKQVSIGYQGLDNVIEYLATFHVAENHVSGTFEVMTAYLGVNFSSFWTFDPGVGSLQPLSHTNGEQALPVILSTADQLYAVGVYSPDLPQPDFPALGYGRFDLSAYNTTKLNAVFRTLSAPSGSYSFRSYLVVGNLQQVQSGMTALYNIFHNAGGTMPSATPSPSPPLPTGLYAVGAAIYFSNGSHFCGFDTMARFTAVTGLNTTAGIAQISGIPNSMVYDGLCGGGSAQPPVVTPPVIVPTPPTPVQNPPLPSGLYAVGAAIYYSNGSHFCGFDTMARFTAVTGLNTTAGVAQISGIPNSMVYDGLCGP